MASEVSICNLALAHLGDEATVSSIDPPEGSQQAEHCARYYPIARNTLLEAHTWSFATRRIPLVELAGTPPDGWSFMYTRPNSCLRALTVLLPGESDSPSIITTTPPGVVLAGGGQEFAEEAIDNDVRVIYSNAEDATLKYIRLVTDTGKFSQLFTNALARLLASMLAGPVIKGSEGMKVAAAQMKWYLEVDLPLAKGEDSNARRLATYDNFTPAGIAARA